MYNGYGFYMDGMLLPVTPPSLKISVGSTNKTVTLINEGEINILKSPSLSEITFEARFPSRKYPFSRDEAHTFDYYYEKFMKLKNDKKPFHFIVLRHTPSGVPTWDTDMTVALESFDITESAEEGDDVLVKFNLKQWKNYGAKSVVISGNKIQKTPNASDTKLTKEVTKSEWTVQSGDTLWSISKSVYGDGSKWEKIYNANKTVIESEAKKHGKADSRKGHWIYTGTKLVIPDVSAVNQKPVTPPHTPAKKTYKVTVIISNVNSKTGNVTLSYVSNGTRRNLSKQDVGTLTVTADSNTEVRVGLHPITATNYKIKDSSGVWSNSDYMYTIKSIQSDSSLSVNWV